MTLAPAPDVEAIVINYLLGRAEVTAIFGTRIGTELDLTGPAPLPALRIGTVGGVVGTPRRLDGTSIQLESWADDRITARDGLAATRAVLLEEGAGSIVGTHAGLGVVTGTSDGQLPRPLPDPETDRPRWLCVLYVYAHPLPQ